VVTSVAVSGVPASVTSAVRFHRKPSRPIAKRMRVPIIMIALRSGGSETSDSTVIHLAPSIAHQNLRRVRRRQRRARQIGNRQHRSQRHIHQQ